MGGTFKRDFVDGVTHLVVSKISGATTAKYTVNSVTFVTSAGANNVSIVLQIAAERKIPVMLERWIHESWDMSQTQMILATDPPLGSLECPPFMNLRVCCSGISKAKKESLKRIIEAKGITDRKSVV